VNIEPATVKRLAGIENIIGIKEASGNVSQMAAILTPCRMISLFFPVTTPSRCRLSRSVAAGSSRFLSNESPRRCRNLRSSALEGDFQGAREIHRRFHPLMEINFVESNPIPVKAALAEMGLLKPVWRLPLVPPKEENRARIRAVLESLELVPRVHAAFANLSVCLTKPRLRYEEETLPAFPRFQGRAESRGIRAAEPDPSTKTVGGQTLGSRREFSSAFAWALSPTCPSIP